MYATVQKDNRHNHHTGEYLELWNLHKLQLNANQTIRILILIISDWNCMESSTIKDKTYTGKLKKEIKRVECNRLPLSLYITYLIYHLTTFMCLQSVDTLSWPASAVPACQYTIIIWLFFFLLSILFLFTANYIFNSKNLFLYDLC